MPFDEDAIARLTPAVRIEVQEYYVRKFLADRAIHEPERRRSKLPRLTLVPRPAESAETPPAEPRRPWPQVWHRNDSSRPTSFLARIVAQH